MNFIFGENRAQKILLPDNIEDYVDGENPVRVIDAYIDSLELSELGFEKPRPNHTGRPMYDPKDLLKLYVYGYMNKIRSSRLLERETKRNLEVIWLINKLSPDHKTIARFRHDNARALKNVFRNFTELCVKLNLFGRELIAIDGSKFKAVNAKDRNFTENKLQKRIAQIDAKINEYMREAEAADSEETTDDIKISREEIAQTVAKLKERKDLYESYAAELLETGETQKSLTDPDSRLMKNNGKFDVCYNVQTAVDAKNKLIVEFDVTNCATDKNQFAQMAERAKEILGVETIAAVADAGYDSSADIIKSIEQNIVPHVAGTDFDICVPADVATDENSSEAPNDAQTDENSSEVQTGEDCPAKITSHNDGRIYYCIERNIAVCPMGEILRPAYYKKSKGKAVFKNAAACKQCKCRCTTSPKARNYEKPMPESSFSKTYNDENLVVNQIHISPDKEIVKQRKTIVEHPFGTIKRSMDASYCLMKGIINVIGEFSLAFLAYNLKRVVKIIGVKKLTTLMAV